LLFDGGAFFLAITYFFFVRSMPVIFPAFLEA
jgi:hypothetical protein